MKVFIEMLKTIKNHQGCYSTVGEIILEECWRSFQVKSTILDNIVRETNKKGFKSC